MIQRKQLFQLCRLSFLCLALVLATVLIFQPAFTIAAQQTYESAPVLSALKILPPELLSGPHHRVEEAVTNNDYFNIYRIDSKFGVFTAVSTAMLRKRIGEIKRYGRNGEDPGDHGIFGFHKRGAVLRGQITPHSNDVRERKMILKFHSRTPSLLQDCTSLQAFSV